MSDAEIREAVEIVKEIEGVSFLEAENKAIKILTDIAESYLSIEGMPEEILPDYTGEICLSCYSLFIGGNKKHQSETHNNTLRLCKLAFLKKCEGLEKVIENTKVPHRTIKVFDMLDPELIEAISTAVCNHLLGGGK